jgi:class 3 adenylate cyclase/tetratricopeptide (TPR) repeat protein
VPICASCAQENPEGAKFCNACAASLVETPASREQRKVVTCLFCDVAGSTALGEQLDPEALRALLARYFERMKGIVEHHGGAVEKFIGDAVMAVFGLPAVHEDDALRALRAAAEMRDALPELGIEGRIGVNTGEVVAGTEERFATGDAVNVAARLEQAAQPGEILIGEATLRLARDAVEAEPVEPLVLKGKREQVSAWRLVSVSTEAAARRPDSPLVGREQELRALGEAWERVSVERRCELVTVVGAAGVGKSRLAAEFLAGVGATVVRGRCLSYGEGITYWPVVEVLTQLESRRSGLELEPAASEALGVLLGGEGASSIDEIAWAFRKLLEAVAGERPLVAVFDDIQWGEEAFLDLVEHVAFVSTGVPILLLCMARPELLDRRGGWAGVMRLQPLDSEEAERLLETRIGGQQLAPAVRERILVAAGGNPLFVEEMAAMLQESDDGEVVVPPTIQALLAARLDQLETADRTVLEHGAVEGELFHRSAVQALTPEESRLTTRLTALVRRELIRPDKAQLAGDDAFRFRHLLIRDAAYEATPKATRADLHERLAAWLEQRGAALVELDELLGHHLEQAYRYRAELGPVNEEARLLARRAAERLGAAASRAFLRKDAQAGVSLISRAVALLPSLDPARVNLIRNVRAMQGIGGDLNWAHTVLSEAIAAGDKRMKAHALVQQGFLQLFTEPEVAPRELIEIAEQAIEVFEELSDELGLARAWRLIAETQYLARRAGPSAEASEQALVHIRRTGDQLEEAESVEWLAITLLMGPTPASEAISRCEGLLEEIAGKPVLEVMVTIVLANLLAMTGRLGEAQELMERARRLRDERVGRIWFFPHDFGLVTTLADDPIAAERRLRWGYETQKRIGGTSHFSAITALLARALYAQGRDDEAEQLTQECEEAARPNDVVASILWRATRARVLARRGELVAAEALAREAVAFAAESDFLDAHGDALSDLAEVLTLVGRPEDATAELERAHQLYEQKGNLVSAERTHLRLAELTTGELPGIPLDPKTT